MRSVGTVEAAFLLDLSPQRVRQLLQQNRIKGAYKKNGKWRIPLYNYMPRVKSRRKGPKGTWRHRLQRVHTYVHVLRDPIAANIHRIKEGLPLLPTMEVVRGSRRGRHFHRVTISGPSEVVHCTKEPIRTGARVWVEVDPSVLVTGHTF